MMLCCWNFGFRDVVMLCCCCCCDVGVVIVGNVVVTL